VVASLVYFLRLCRQWARVIFVTAVAWLPACAPLDVDEAAAPVVASLRPAHASTGVHVARPIVITFEDAVPVTWSEHRNVTIEPDVDCRFAWHPEAHTLTCEPTLPLRPATTYTVTVRKAESTAVEAAGGLNVATSEALVSTFTTQPVDVAPAAPSVQSTMPADGWWDVRNGYDEVVVTFSDPMDRTSVLAAFTGGALTRRMDGATPASVACSEVTWSDGGDVVTCHLGDVQEGHYALTLDGNARSLDGTGLAPMEVHWYVRDPPSMHRTSWLGTLSQDAAFDGRPLTTQDLFFLLSFETQAGGSDALAAMSVLIPQSRGLWRPEFEWFPELYQQALIRFEADAVRSGGTLVGGFGAGPGCPNLILAADLYGDTVRGSVYFDPRIPFNPQRCRVPSIGPGHLKLTRADTFTCICQRPWMGCR